MRDFFGAYGKVVDATVMLDRESGRSKGFGFVTFEDASNADQLVGKVGLILDDKQVNEYLRLVFCTKCFRLDRSKDGTTPKSARSGACSHNVDDIQQSRRLF